MTEISDDEITRWLAEVGGGDRAAQIIWDQFFPKMVGVAKRRMGRAPTADRDEEDIALSAMNSFFQGAGDGRFEPRNRDELWRLLVTITVRKVAAERRKRMAAKRGGGSAPVPIDHDLTNSNVFEQVVDNSAMPELIEDVRSACRDLIDTLDDPKLRAAALMRMESYSNDEIAARLGISLEQTKYLFKQIRQKWDQYLRGC